VIAPLRPDSALADAADGMLRASAPPVLVEHCLRTHAFAVALLDAARRPYDPELLFVAAALHDLGLTPAWDDGTTSFERRGAEVARQLLLDEGASPPAAELVHDAIALHLELSSATDPRPEVAGVGMGAAVDVLGLRIDELPAGTLDDVLARHPRLGLKDWLVEAMVAEAAVKPGSRAAALDREFGFPALIAAAPFTS
jgi:hypothetical protein